ncbi:MAG: glycosyltransferase [Candidatus Eremiobacteraeota bacterium]|nr:glycosyltransferase [Candidatus Eremiobacteraeota bacterium]
MEKLHVAMFSNVYAPVVNGVATSVKSFREGLEELGHQVYIFAPGGDSEHEERFVFQYPAIELPMQKYPLAVPVSTLADQVFPVLKPDIIHAHHPALLGRAAARKSEEYGIPFVFTYHTRYHDYAHYAEPFPKDRIKELITHWLGHFMASCHRLIVPSHSIKELVAETYGVTRNVSVVATGVDFERFGQAEPRRQSLGWKDDEVILISAGRLAREKNFDLLIRAFAKLPEQLNARLVILGEGDHRPVLEQLAQELGVASRVDLVGLVPFDQMPGYLSSADLFCFASVTETQGLVTLEAMASGLPVAAVEASGTSDVVDSGVEGLLTEVDADALAAAMERLVRSPELRHCYSESARRKARHYDHLAQARKLSAVYAQAREDCRSGSRLEVELHSHWEAFVDFFRGALPVPERRAS